MDRSSLLKIELFKRLLAVGRWKPLNPVVRFLFKHMNHLLPVNHLEENADWMAFPHPQPAYPLHILILPKQGFSTLNDVRDDPAELYTELFILVKLLIKRFDLDSWGYRLITNGGPNQSIPQWHWHLISENWEGKVA